MIMIQCPELVPSVSTIRAHEAVRFVLCHHHLLTLLCCQLCRSGGTARRWGLQVNMKNIITHEHTLI